MLSVMDLSKILIFAGVALIAFGLLSKLGFGRLPGDINYHGKGVFISVPIISSIILSILLTLLINFLAR